MHRRTLLAATGGLAIGAVSMAAADSDETSHSDEPTTDGHDCETVEIATAKSGDEVVATEDVPEPWWEQVERTREIQEEITDAYADEPWFDGSGRTTGDEEICGRNAFVVTVYTDDEETAREVLGDLRQDVGIRFEEPLDLEPLGGDPLEDDVPVSFDEENADDDLLDQEDAENGNASDDEYSSDDTDSVPGFGVLATAVGLAGAGCLLAGRGRVGGRDGGKDGDRP